MITKVSYLTSQIASLLDDPGRTFATDEYLIPFIQLALDKLELACLQNPNLGSLYSTVVIPDVPAGTTDLSDYFAPGEPLELLIDVTTIKERTVGGLRQEQDWNYMNRVNDIPTIQPVAFNSYYAVRDNTIVLSGADQAMDLRFFGKFAPERIKDAKSAIIPNTSVILTYFTASLVAFSRGNRQMGVDYRTEAQFAMDDFINHAIMEMQSERIRLRSYSGRGNIRV